MATAVDFARIAEQLEGTVAKPHMDRTAFRVNRIYATLAADGETANLKFSQDEQALKCMTHPEAFEPVSGGWGKQGWTLTTLAALTKDELKAALEMAWMHAVPKKPIR